MPILSAGLALAVGVTFLMCVAVLIGGRGSASVTEVSYVTRTQGSTTGVLTSTVLTLLIDKDMHARRFNCTGTVVLQY
jgi:hypothetical protein